MTIQPISEGWTTLFFTAQELSRRGLSPDTLTQRQAMDLVRTARRADGRLPEMVTELEVYPEQMGVLIFAHLRPARPVPIRPIRRGRVRRYPT